MALSSTERETAFHIFGIPKGAAGFSVDILASIFGPAGTTFDFTAVVNKLTALLDTVDTSADRIAMVQALILEWNTITSYSETEVYQGAGSGGVLAHDERRRQNIRDRLGDLIGFACPTGGFMAEIRGRKGSFRIRK
jgi:hypothetical protein